MAGSVFLVPYDCDFNHGPCLGINLSIISTIHGFLTNPLFYTIYNDIIKGSDRQCMIVELRM